MKNANPTRFGPHGITGRSSTPALIAREELEHCGVHRFIDDGLKHRLHVPSALNIGSQGQ